MIKVVRNRKPKTQHGSKLVMKATEHAARKQQVQHTYKPNPLNERTANKMIGVGVVVVVITAFALLAALLS